MMSKKVLIVDDEKTIVDVLTFNLNKDGYETLCAYDGAQGLQMAIDENPDLILLDIMLPKLDGFEVCKTLRKSGNNVPIIMITAREEENDKIFGLEIGADDYITKPFSVRELMARLKSNMRRAVLAPQASQPAPQEGLFVDVERHRVFKNGTEIELTQREYDLLKFLTENIGKVVSRQELMTEVWQYDYFGDVRAVDVAVRRLREKLEDNPAEPVYVITKRGVGYYYAGN